MLCTTCKCPSCGGCSGWCRWRRVDLAKGTLDIIYEEIDSLSEVDNPMELKNIQRHIHGGYYTMNIFVLDKDPFVAAQQSCDKHVVKMILETGQMLSPHIGCLTVWNIMTCQRWSSRKSKGGDWMMVEKMLCEGFVRRTSLYTVVYENTSELWLVESSWSCTLRGILIDMVRSTNQKNYSDY